VALLKAVEEPVDLHGRRRVEVFDPGTLERIGEVEIATREDVRTAVDRARKAFHDWSELPFEQRGRMLLRARDLLIARVDAFADTVCRDTGKPRVEAMLELMIACDALTFYARRARTLLRDERKSVHLMRNKKLVLSYQPMGVIGLITPWNFPFVLALNPAVQALMAGNTVVLKPSEFTPFTGMCLGPLFEEAGLPKGVFQVLVGDGSTGAALVESGCNKISFTGSVATGRKIAEACGRQLIPCTLELGGKDPMVVCDDADLERAAQGAVYGAFANSGQICVSTERVYVTEKLAEPFTRRVVELTRELRQGPESEGEVDIGAISSPAQLDVIDRHVKDAVEKGALVLTGGRRNPRFKGLFFEPTVLTDVNHDMDVMREETFGPVLPIQVVRDEQEAVRLANESRFGLNANIWTRDRAKGLEIAKRIQAGTTTVNDCVLAYGIAESPFGGVKESGIGRVNGELGLKSFCHVQAVILDRFGRKRQLLGYPYTGRKLRWIRRILNLLYRSPVGRVLGG
jgi:succinate-semialdehyde dehydrogenase/glutarate-semialdehyde dehydrogenase